MLRFHHVGMSETPEELIEAAARARQHGQLDDALRDIDLAIALSRREGNRPGLIASLKLLGHVQADRRNLEASVSAYVEALQLARASPDPMLVAHTARHLGDAYLRVGDTTRAAPAYAEALALYESHPGDAGLDHANALRSLALLLDDTHRPGEAALAWAQARDRYAAAGIRAGVAECTSRLLKIRDATESDFERIVQLNDAEVQQTSAMDLARLQRLHALSSYHRVVEVDGRVGAFLLAMRSGAAYENENFHWFTGKVGDFMYVDRIVVGADLAGMGIGGALYRDLFSHARALGIATITCEYNIEPPNPASRAFHDKFGFHELGTHWVAGGSKRVSLQAATI